MTLEERVAVLEQLMCESAGEKMELVAALSAAIGEANPHRRLSLLTAIRGRADASQLTLPITDAQLDHVERGRQRTREALDGAFLRAIAPAAVRDRAGL